MSLIEEMMEDYIMVNKISIDDGEDGFVTRYEDGARFKAVVTRDSTIQSRIAENEGMSSVYTVTTHANAILHFHDIIKCVRNGKLYRATSDGDENLTPEISDLNLSQVSAENWSLTK